MRIYIVGLKNSGKSTTGKKLARKLNLEFIDLDELIEQQDGRKVTEIFANDGEEIFRQKEKDALELTTKKDNIIVATGGGAPRFHNNMETMINHGLTIYLRLDEDTLVGRLKVAAKDRPVVKGKSPEEIRAYVRDIFENHEHTYLKSNIVVDSKNLAPDELVNRILELYQPER